MLQTSDPRHVLVYGATGAQGHPVAEQLLAAGHRVRVLTRDADRAEDLRALGAEIAIGDLANTASLAAAHDGIDAVFLLIPFFDPNPHYIEHAIKAASAAGIDLVVWNPTGAIPQQPTGNPGIDVRLHGLGVLQKSGIPFIGIEPTAYMENLLQPPIVEELVRDDVIAYPFPPGASMQWISHRDVAALVVSAFEHPELASRIIPVAGPERMAGEDIGHAFSAGLGRPVSFRVMPPEEFGAMLAVTMGPEAGEAITRAYRGLFAHPEMLSSNVDTDAVSALLPVEQTTMAEWVRGKPSLSA